MRVVQKHFDFARNTGENSPAVPPGGSARQPRETWEKSRGLLVDESVTVKWSSQWGPPHGFDVPAIYYTIPGEERDERCDLTSDLCVVDEKHFFIRGCLEIPILDGGGPFVWGVWASLSQENFKRVVQLWETEGREVEPPYFGWLSTSIPLYPETLSLKTHVHTRPVGQRPFIELEPTDHPLAVEQRQGITMARVREIAAALLHHGDK